MLVRTALLRDIPDLVEWGAEHHARHYGHVPYSAQRFAQTLHQAMTDGDYRVWIATRMERLCGLLIGTCQPMASAEAEYATDVLFLPGSGGDPLLAKFVDWCNKRKVAEILMGVSRDDDPRLDKLYARHGLERAGGMYRKITGGAP